MKKLVFTVALCLVAGLSFGQKKAVNAAKNEVKNDKPNLEEARTQIKAAMADPETKDGAETYYVAGLIENKQFDLERTKEILGQQPNEEVMYQGLGGIMPYFLMADSLDQLPDEKGKIKPKFTKDIKSYIAANRPYYINGGAYYFEKKDFQKAYDFFDTYLEIPNMPMFKGDKTMSIEGDTLYPQIKFYAAIAASQLTTVDGVTPEQKEQGRKNAIAMYESLKGDNYKGNEVYQYLCYEYEQTKDTVNLIKTLNEGVQKFPEEPYYLLSLINQYIYSNQNDKAVELINKAIESKPDAQLYDVLGRIYEDRKETDKAIECFQKSLSLNPDFVEAIGNMGRVYYNRGVEAQAAANEIKDNKAYTEAVTKAKEIFKQALPYFEKANKLKPDDREYMTALRSIYYTLGMSEFEAIDKKLNE